MNLALTFYSVLKMPVDDIIACSVAAENAGFSHICVAESFYRDGFALASAIASKTRIIRFGTSVMPIYTRTPFALAMGSATLNELSHGRLAFLGLGVGYRARTEQFFGTTQSDMSARMREYVEIIRKLQRAEETSHAGRFFRTAGFPALSTEPLNIPVYFGSSGPRMLKLAGEVADGVILNSISSPEYADAAIGWIGEGAKEAGRNPSKIEVAHSIIFSVSDDSQEAVDAAKEDILFYVSYPELDPILDKSPFKGDALKMRALIEKGDKAKAISLISEEMLDMFAVYGTPAECRRRLRDFVTRRHVTLPIIRVSTTPYKVKEERKDAYMRAIESLRGI